jgi:hypothetical protein
MAPWRKRLAERHVSRRLAIDSNGCARRSVVPWRDDDDGRIDGLAEGRRRSDRDGHYSENEHNSHNNTNATQTLHNPSDARRNCRFKDQLGAKSVFTNRPEVGPIFGPGALRAP